MFEMKYQPPKKIVTTNVVVEYIKGPQKEDGRRAVRGYVAENLVAARGPNGLYAVRTAKKAIVDPQMPVFEHDPFSFTQRLKDHFAGYADYTHPFKDVVEDFALHESRRERHHQGFPAAKDATHISEIPTCICR